MRKQNYLNNKDMLKEIHKSKMSFCYSMDEEYNRFDIIVEDYDDIFKPEIIQQARENRAHQLSGENYNVLTENGMMDHAKQKINLNKQKAE